MRIVFGILLCLLACPAFAAPKRVQIAANNSGSMYIKPSSGTVANPASGLGNLIGQVQQFTVSDLQAALADANAQIPPDTRHGPCWSALIPVAQQSINNPLPTSLGLAQLAQKSFDIQNRLGQPLIPDSVVTACALTVFDLKMDFAKLAGLVGLKALPVLALPAGL